MGEKAGEEEMRQSFQIRRGVSFDRKEEALDCSLPHFLDSANYPYRKVKPRRKGEQGKGNAHLSGKMTELGVTG